VELKKARVPNLLENPRSHPIVGHPVHQATLQAANYLRTLDEDTHQQLGRYRVDCRRSASTVLVGHSAFVRDYTAEEISVAFRTYNALLSRIEVMTYDELIDSAERSLSFAAPSERVDAIPDSP
jgi:hypothetical protein